MKKRNVYIWAMRVLMWLAAGITAALTLFLLGYVLIKGLPNITWELLSTKPSYLRGTVFRLSWVVRMMVGRFIITSVKAPASRLLSRSIN